MLRTRIAHCDEPSTLTSDEPAVLLVAAILRRAREDAKKGDRKAAAWILGIQAAAAGAHKTQGRVIRLAGAERKAA